MDTKTRVYLDYAASTPVDERVLAAMLPYFSETYGNPSSLHYFGQQAEAALEGARETVAKALHCRSEEVVFTACGTESDNLALRGMAFLQRKQKGANRIVISPVEHHAVSSTARQLADEFGFEVDFLPVDEFGMVNPEEIEGCLKADTAVVSVVYANNEIGTINPIAEIGAICRKRGIPFHTDAVQGAAHLSMDVVRDHIDMLAIGAHKFYGPKGIGALFIRRGTSLLPIVTGGSQESGLRAGTQNIPYIVGLAEALRLAQEERQSHVRTPGPAAKCAHHRGARFDRQSAPDRPSDQTAAQPCQLCFPGCGRQYDADAAGYAGFCVFIRFGLQGRHPPAIRYPHGDWPFAQLGAGLAAGDPGEELDHGARAGFPESAARDCREIAQIRLKLNHKGTKYTKSTKQEKTKKKDSCHVCLCG